MCATGSGDRERKQSRKYFVVTTEEVQIKMLAGKGMIGKREAFKSEIARVQEHVPVRVKAKAGKFREPCLMRNIESLVRKKNPIPIPKTGTTWHYLITGALRYLLCM